jgi:hypothetical protein
VSNEPGLPVAVLKKKSPGRSGAFLDVAWNEKIEIVYGVGDVTRS